MPVPFDLTSTRGRQHALGGNEGGKRETSGGSVMGGRRGGNPPPSLGHLIGRQSFLIGSQEIY